MLFSLQKLLLDLSVHDNFSFVRIAFSPNFIYQFTYSFYIFLIIMLFITVFLQWLVWRKAFDTRIWWSLVPIVGGILLTSVTELSFNIFGFCAAFFGCLATSTKTILAESLLHGYKFDRYTKLQPSFLFSL
jgi:hypothetical protein